MTVYNPRGGNNVHIDVVLSRISLGYPNNGMIGDVVAPVVTVRKQSDLFHVFGRESWYPEDDLRGPGTMTPEVPGLELSTTPYFCTEKALKIAVTPEERENADSPLSPDRDGTEFITEKLNLAREQRVQTAVQTAANYATGYKVTLSGTDQWNDYANSDPIGDIKTAIRKIHSGLFMEPNLGIFPYEVMSQLEDHTDFIERIKYSQPGVLTADIIATVMGLSRIVVPGLGYNTATNPGATFAAGYLWGKHVSLHWVPPSAGRKTPAFMYEFVWAYTGRGAGAQRVDRWYDNDRDADMIRVRRRYDHQFIAVNGSGESIAGYLITDAIA